MYKRPQRGESEEDLLKLQEEFIKDKALNNITPAAKLDVSDKREIVNQEELEVSQQLPNAFEEIPSFINIGNIVEKINPSYIPSPITLQKSGFPVARRRDTSNKSSSGSIFAQHAKKFKATNTNTSCKTSNQDGINSIPGNILPNQSFILTGSDKDDIHKENVHRISQMTEGEILEEHNKLISTIDPAIVAFLKSRRHKLRDKTQPNMEQQINAAKDIQTQDIGPVSKILNQPESEKWLNFDKIELTKLTWMKDINITEIKSHENYEARFDFDGWLLPYIENEINEANRILYHHGDEPGRPGYTLQELFQLCRSNIIQQKITALNAVANLLSLETSGVYDNVIDIPIEQVFFVLRFCLDDNAPPLLNASVKAMRNLFYHPIDEACLDSLLGFGIGKIQPSLLSELEDKDDDYTVNDQQLAEANLVKCLSRTEILTRIRYIINTIKPPLETICYSLELLIRLARDSERIVNLILNCDNLMSSITTYFVPKVLKENICNLNYGVPLKQAVKLCRILSTRNKAIAEKLINKYQIMDSVMIYLSNEHFSSNTTGIQLQTECLHLWDVFINYDLALDQFMVMQPILLQMLHYHVQNTNQDTSTSYTMHGHVAAVLILISSIASKRSYCILPYIDLLSEQALRKWTMQFSNSKKFLCGKLLIISTFLQCLSCLTENKIDINNDKINNMIKTMMTSHGFKIVTSNIKTGSNILCKHESHRPSKNLLSVEAAMWNASEHIVPVLQTNSSLPFLNALSRFISVTDSKELKILFLLDENLKKYFEHVRDAKDYNLTSNWFTRIESEFLMNIIKISFAVYRDIDTSTFYDVAVKCLCIFNSEQKQNIEYILKNIIFNKNYYPSYTLLQNLEIQDGNSVLNDCIENLNYIFDTYMEVLGLRLDIHNFKYNLSVDIKIGNIVPIDWIYSPIIVLYSNSQKNRGKINETKLTFIVQNCLRWIYIYEKYFSSLASLINPADKFCRLACIFLASDDLFFVAGVRNLLEASFKHFIKNDLNKLDFKKSVHGLVNFQDFYTQLIEQYQGVSYGDILFGNFILIPMMQRENVQYRKLLWSEYAGIVQICNITSDQLMYSIDVFLEPPENDISLLKCYRRCILSGRMRESSVLYRIAKHHLDTYVQNKKT